MSGNKYGACRGSWNENESFVAPMPITPVSADGLILLQNLILKNETHALDETSKQNLQ